MLCVEGREEERVGVEVRMCETVRVCEREREKRERKRRKEKQKEGDK